MKKIDTMSQELPNTVERMTALETLHNQSKYKLNCCIVCIDVT